MKVCTVRAVSIRAWVAAAVALAALAAPAAARAATASLDTWVTMSDRITLETTVTGQAPLSARPAIVEFSPYGPGTMTTSDGPAYN